jgi:hypothetical protein
VPTFQVRLPVPGKAAPVSEAFRIHGRGRRTYARKQARGLRSGPVTTATLHPLARKCALFLADGDRRRFRIISATEVLVVNRPHRPS